MSAFDLFIERITENQRRIVFILNDLFVEYPHVVMKVRFKIPFYYLHSWVCYLNPVKPDKIELVFINGKKLSNVQGLLDDRGRKMVAGIMIDDPEHIPLENIQDIFAEALILDEEKKK